MVNVKSLLTLTLDAAAAGADLLRKNFMHDAGITHSEGRDIKTLADVAAQEQILNTLKSSGIPVLAEEGDHQPIDSGELVWLVDPLDGTLNFSRGFPIAAVSIALWEKGKPILGVIQDVFSNQVYSGLIGEGAWLDAQSIHVSYIENKEQAILATGFPTGRSYATESLMQFVDSVQKYKKVRMLGSAAMMLAQVAAGRFDAYEEEDIYLWDVAAGLAIVQAAGGEISLASGSGQHKFRVRASNGRL